jgi:NTP pyrophosphatase (non-canonical NTP hydrolase)
MTRTRLDAPAHLHGKRAAQVHNGGRGEASRAGWWGFKSRHPDHRDPVAIRLLEFCFVDMEMFHVKPSETEAGLSLRELQASIEATFGERDRTRGVDGTFRWWVEEVGEVAKALRQRHPAELEHELGDALAWLTSVANLVDVDLERAAARFMDSCPRCGQSPCTCPIA